MSAVRELLPGSTKKNTDADNTSTAVNHSKSKHEVVNEVSGVNVKLQCREENIGSTSRADKDVKGRQESYQDSIQERMAKDPYILDPEKGNPNKPKGSLLDPLTQVISGPQVQLGSPTAIESQLKINREMLQKKHNLAYLLIFYMEI